MTDTSRRRSAWRFRLLTLAAAAGCALTTSLGFWQWGRAQDKLALQAQIQARRELPALSQEVLLLPASPDLQHRRVALRGRWLAQQTVFLENRQMDGRVGFYVVTPLQLAGTGDANDAKEPGVQGAQEGRQAVVLVQRGWAPRDQADRSRLPPIETPSGLVTLEGRIAPAPAKLYDFDPAARGSIRQNLDWAAFRQETGLPLVAGSVQQLGPSSEGLARDWPLPASGADKNYGYAFQWWALAGVIFILYVWFQFIAPRRRASRSA